jgi:hypothetical protein
LKFDQPLQPEKHHGVRVGLELAEATNLEVQVQRTYWRLSMFQLNSSYDLSAQKILVWHSEHMPVLFALTSTSFTASEVEIPNDNP